MFNTLGVIILDNIVKLKKIMDEEGLSDIMIVSPENIEYFLGVKTIADSLLLLHISSSEAKLYLPILEYYRYNDLLRDTDIEVVAVSKNIKPKDAEILDISWKDLVKNIVENSEKIGIDKSHPTFLSSILLEIRDEHVIDVSKKINKYRMVKEEWEIEAIKKAIEITSKGIYEIVDNLSETMTEAKVAGIFEYSVRSEGVEEYAFTPLTLFKPGNSYPHNLPSDTVLGKNNLVLVDVGVKYMRRCSDITRMIIWGSISEEEKKAIEIVNEAIDRAIEKIEPGVKANEVDQAARKYIEEHGYGDKFIHGLGHGIGVVVHEHPYIRSTSDTVLEPGMVFTIEPGIYVAGKYGIRIEEDVLVTKKGVSILSKGIERVIT